MYGASTAPTTKMAMQTSPTRAGPFRRRRCQASPQRPRLARGAARTTIVGSRAVISGVPDPRIEEGVADVDDQVHEEEDRGEDQDRRLDDHVVVVLDGGHDPRPHAVP